jgi:hypothetical protein
VRNFNVTVTEKHGQNSPRIGYGHKELEATDTPAVLSPSANNDSLHSKYIVRKGTSCQNRKGSIEQLIHLKTSHPFLAPYVSLIHYAKCW